MLILTLLLSCSSLVFSSGSSVSSVKAINEVGLTMKDAVPSVILTDTNGKEFDFAKQTKDTVLVFFRGSW